VEITSPVSKARSTSALILVGVQPGAAAGKSRSGPPGKSGTLHKRGERAQVAAAQLDLLMNTTAELLEQREVVEGLTKTLRDETAKSSDLASKLRLAEEALQVNAESDAKALENQLLNVSADLLESRAVIQRLTKALDIARAQLCSSQLLVKQNPVRERRTNSSQSPVEQSPSEQTKALRVETASSFPAVEEAAASPLASRHPLPLPVESPVPDLQLRLASVEESLKAERSRSAGLAAQLQNAEEGNRIMQLRVNLVEDCNDWRRSCKDGDKMYKPFYERVALGEALAYICSGQPPHAAWGPAADSKLSAAVGCLGLSGSN
jgi:hypothetical protein